MPILHNSIIASTTADDPVTRSLRFDTNGKLSRTFGTPNSKKTFTIAFWVKRAGFSSTNYKEIWQYNRGGRGGGMGFAPTQSNWMDEEEFQFSSRNANTGVADVNIALTTRFRDPAAWMHIALVVDTTLGSSEAADRIKIFVNNERQTNYDTSHTHSYYWPAQNYEFSEIFGGTGAPQNIGLRDTNNHPLNGYLADIYFIDGAAIEPNTNFIESTGYGSYKPKAFDMSGYSGNSFHIDAQPAHDADLLVSSIDRNDGDTDFADAAKGRDVNVRGTPHHSIAVGNPFTGDGRAIYFDGNDNITTSASTDLAIASGDSFTAECWVYFNSTHSTHDGIFSGYASGLGWVIECTGGSWGVYDSSGGRQTSSTTATTGEWHHVALVKTDNTSNGARLYLNGNKIDDVTISSNLTSARSITLGNYYATNSSYDIDGYIFDARFTKGEELYTGSTYTVPASALEKGDNTKLLIQPDKDDSSIEDKSDSSHTITATGSPTITASTPYDAAAKSTAIRLDSESLITETQMDFAIGSSDTFTAEGWFYMPSSPAANDAFFSTRHGGADHGWQLNVNSTAQYWSFYSYPDASAQDTTVALPSTGEWFHLAVVKNSSSTDGVSVYVNGAFKFTATDGSNRTSASSLTIGDYWGAAYGALVPIDAYVYDIRFTKNETRYSGTSTSEWGNFDEITAPFELNPVYIGGDQSGNKNHFEPTNISSHDVMLDTPTKNYAVMNPLNGEDSSHAGYGEGNLHITYNNAGQAASFGATMAFPKTGKWYAEVYIKSYGSSDSTRPKIGICRSDYDLTKYNNDTAQIGGADCFHYQKGGNKGGNSAGSSSYGASHTTGDIIGVAFDSDNGTLTFYKNGTSQGQAFSGLTKEYILATSGYDTSNSGTDDSVILNFGQDPTFAGNYTETPDSAEWAHSPPTGFKSLNTSNLAAPSVNPAENFNSLVYQGASPSDKAVTGVGFQPDLVWIKARTQTYNHAIYDSVRGATKELHPNTANDEDTDSNGLKTFDSDGFTVGSDGEVGDPTGTRISWNWKAHQSPASSDARTTYTVKVEDNSGDAWDSSGSYYDSSTYLPSVYMEIFENRNSSLVSLGKVAVQYYDSSGSSNSDLSEQTYTLECADLNAIAVKWHYDTSGDGQEYDYPNYYNDYLNDQKITILDGTSSTSGTWLGVTGQSGTDNYSNDDGTSSNYSPPTGWANGDTLKSATTSYNGSDTATLTSGSSSGPTEKYNAAAGFTIISYSGDGFSDGDSQTLDHSLGVPLEFVIAKPRTNNQSMGGNWIVWHKDLGSSEYLILNSTSAKKTDYNSNEVIATAVSGTQHQIIVNNAQDYSSNYHYLNMGPYSGSAGEDYILYGWAGVEGYSKFGTYEGNGNPDGPFIYTGFQPRWIMVKPIDDPYAWYIHDTARSPYNYSDNELTADTSGAEYSVSGAGAGERFDILSNGFKHRTSNAAMNANDKTMVYAAFGKSPFAKSNAR